MRQSIQTNYEQNNFPTTFKKKYLATVNFNSPPKKGKHHADSPVKPERQILTFFLPGKRI